jgi:hypothetical protein
MLPGKETQTNATFVKKPLQAVMKRRNHLKMILLLQPGPRDAKGRVRPDKRCRWRIDGDDVDEQDEPSQTQLTQKHTPECKTMRKKRIAQYDGLQCDARL